MIIGIKAANQPITENFLFNDLNAPTIFPTVGATLVVARGTMWTSSPTMILQITPFISVKQENLY